MTIAFFGHRQIFNEQAIKERIEKVLKEYACQKDMKVLIGCHGEFDRLALLTSINYKKKTNENIKISVVLTNLSYLNKDELGFSKVDNYNNLGCETIFYDIEEIHFKKRITASNKKMVDESDLIICYVDMKNYKSGAKTTILYAIKQNKKIINLFEKSDRGV